MPQQPLILTLKIDEQSQAFFDAQRKRYFPPELNYLDAHLMLFHQLPDHPATYQFLTAFAHEPFDLKVTGLMSLGAGVAYRVESPQLNLLHRELSKYFKDDSILQDRQGFRPHITIMNKTTPEMARALVAELAANFEPFSVQAVGLDLWTYLDGPWRHEANFDFS